jgi:hypothetical protein
VDIETIDTLHRNKAGKISDKWASYLSYYDLLLAPYRDKLVRVLEIGVQNGGSLETWAKYFFRGELFVGCDIDPRCTALLYDDSRIKIVIGDANSAVAYQKIKLLSSQFDIIIDDGSHQSSDIVNSFINYFPILGPGGLYVIEDAGCLFLNDYGGGVLNEFGGYAFFKRLTDVVNFQFWRNELSISAYLRTFFDLGNTPDFIVNGWIESIEFRNSMITIKKSRCAGHDKIGERVVVGTEAAVQDWGGRRPA